MNFLLALIELAFLGAVIFFDVSLGFANGHKLADMPLNVFLLSAALKVPEWLIGAGFVNTVFRIKYIRYMRRQKKLERSQRKVLVKRSKEWWLNRARLEGDHAVGAGVPKLKEIDPGKFGLKLQWYSALFAALFGFNLYTFSYNGTYLINPFVSIIGVSACPIFWLVGMIIKYRRRAS